MTDIYKNTWSYRIAKNYMLLAFRLYFGKIKINGIENIPTDGRIIFAPNHRNALMDALVAALITPKGITTSFLARSDLFQNKIVAKIMRFAKIMPAFRIRDGFEKLSRNNAVFDECVKLLEKNQALCIMPEGNQETEHRLRPLVKGIFRIAFSVEQGNKSEKPLKIIPVGIDYGSIEKFGKHVIINIGEPIDIRSYAESYNENPAVAMNDLKECLQQRLEQLMIHIPSEKYYNTIVRTISLVNYRKLKGYFSESDLYSSYQNKKKLSDILNDKAESSPENMDKLAKLSHSLQYELTRYKLRASNIVRKPELLRTLTTAIALLILFPVALVGIVCNIVPFQLPVIIRRKLHIEFRGFYSSLQLAVGLFTFPMFYSIQSALLCSLANLSWWYMPALFPLFLIAGWGSFKWYCVYKKTIAEIRFLFLKKKSQEVLLNLRSEVTKKVIS